MKLQEFFWLIITTFFGGLITYFFTTRKLKMQFNHRLIENLYEKRYQTYTKLLEITQDLGKSKTSFDEHKKAREDLKKWITTSGGYLLLTKNSLEELNTMKDLLKKGKSNKNGWDKEHYKKIFKCRNALRGCLRDEFEFFHEAKK